MVMIQFYLLNHWILLLLIVKIDENRGTSTVRFAYHVEITLILQEDPANSTLGIGMPLQLINGFIWFPSQHHQACCPSWGNTATARYNDPASSKKFGETMDFKKWMVAASASHSFPFEISFVRCNNWSLTRKSGQIRLQPPLGGTPFRFDSMISGGCNKHTAGWRPHRIELALQCLSCKCERIAVIGRYWKLGTGIRFLTGYSDIAWYSHVDVCVCVWHFDRCFKSNCMKSFPVQKLASFIMFHHALSKCRLRWHLFDCRLRWHLFIRSLLVSLNGKGYGCSFRIFSPLLCSALSWSPFLFAASSSGHQLLRRPSVKDLEASHGVKRSRSQPSISEHLSGSQPNWVISWGSHRRLTVYNRNTKRLKTLKTVRTSEQKMAGLCKWMWFCPIWSCYE